MYRKFANNSQLLIHFIYLSMVGRHEPGSLKINSDLASTVQEWSRRGTVDVERVKNLLVVHLTKNNNPPTSFADPHHRI